MRCLHSVALFCSLNNMEKIKVLLLTLYFMVLEKGKILLNYTDNQLVTPFKMLA